MMDAAKEVTHGAEEALGAGFAAGVGGAILKRRQDGESDKGSNKGSDPPSLYGSPEAQAASAAASAAAGSANDPPVDCGGNMDQS